MVSSRLLLEVEVALAETIEVKFPEIESLRPQQVNAILSFILRRDVLAVLPIGSWLY